MKKYIENDYIYEDGSINIDAVIDAVWERFKDVKCSSDDFCREMLIDIYIEKLLLPNEVTVWTSDAYFPDCYNEIGINYYTDSMKDSNDSIYAEFEYDEEEGVYELTSLQGTSWCYYM